MEYHHPGVGTIGQPTWWVQCTYVHVVYGYANRKGHSNIPGDWDNSGDGRGGVEMEQRGGRFLPKTCPK